MYFFFVAQMGVSKNSGTPKWMVYNGNPLLIHGMIYGGKKPYFRKHPNVNKDTAATWIFNETKASQEPKNPEAAARYECQAVRDFLQSASLWPNWPKISGVH